MTLKQKILDKKICLVLSDDENYNQTNDAILKMTTKLKGIYVSLNKKYNEFQTKIQKLKLNKKQIHFIGANEKNEENCTRLTSPQSLTELSIAITIQINKGGYDYLLFDSLSTLLIYNEMKTAERFTHYMINKLREFNIAGIIISLKKDPESEKLANIITQFCDEKIEF